MIESWTIPRKASIIIKTTDSSYLYLFTDEDLEQHLANSHAGQWSGLYYAPNNHQSINPIRNYLANNVSNTWTSEHIDWLGTHNIYLTSPNLGGFLSLGPCGNMDILKKIPVTSTFGFLIVDSVVLNNDYIGCGRQLLSKLQFKIADTHGNIVPLHGAHIDFSIVLSTVKEDI